jgi:uncharacterized protein (TIGR02246 family)
MKSKALLGLVVAALLFAPGLVGQGMSKDEKSVSEDPVHNELRALMKELVEAVNKNDIDALLTRLDKDVVATWMDGKVSRGPAEVKAYLEEKTKGPNAVVKSYKTEPAADDLSHMYGDTAVAFGHSKDTFVMNDGKEFTFASRWSATLVKKDGKWLVAGFHGSAGIFDNPVLDTAVRRTATWTAIVAGLVGLVVGAGVMWLLRRRAR